MVVVGVVEEGLAMDWSSSLKERESLVRTSSRRFRFEWCSRTGIVLLLLGLGLGVIEGGSFGEECACDS